MGACRTMTFNLKNSDVIKAYDERIYVVLQDLEAHNGPDTHHFRCHFRWYKVIKDDGMVGMIYLASQTDFYDFPLLSWTRI
jgi:hypothetical protein